ncbi:23S rRNA (uracil(1939)-C(5))-methyltransferase RlmD [Paenibacillus humicola]|uniref:23S rRNA (uracil(1939)-C(5))-methyltransferase RlmD n=1 Tax=Paenibacillus humicola TaxID=3110540 RepID=UPI00237A25F3|nr:23S rRNA (uracil(1939)-C(5))-methyltransferase RlmD [Paenibacillus humicola]
MDKRAGKNRAGQALPGTKGSRGEAGRAGESTRRERGFAGMAETKGSRGEAGRAGGSARRERGFAGMAETKGSQGEAGRADKSTRRGRGFAGKPADAAAVRIHGAQRASADDVRVGDRIVVTIKRIGINGEGVGYFRRKAVFVPGALPGEVVKARVTAAEKNRLVAELTEIEKRSPERIEPACPVYEACGGCQLQHLSYAGQLAAKEELVREAFSRYAGIEGAALPLRPMLGMDEPWGYRNKAQLQAGRGPGGRPALGLYEPGSHRLVDIAGCAVQHPALNAAAAAVLRCAEQCGVPLGERGRGLRTVVLRVAPAAGELQLTLVAAEERFEGRDRLVAAIRRDIPAITSISVNVNKDRTPLVFGERTVLLWGKPALETELGELRFALSPRAFFQLNPAQTTKLYDAVREAAALTGSETVVDAYCGTGTIALWLAPFAREVRGIETIREAVDDAERNAALNGRTNARFYAGKAEELLPRWTERGFRPDVIVVDPPRTGCDPRLLQTIVDTKPKRFVYVSCNPSTLAKDCRFLFESGFNLEWIQPVDMFPHTAHVECVIGIQRIDT